MDKRWLKEQKEEFHEMDEDNDGMLSKDELLVKPILSFDFVDQCLCLESI